MERLTSSLGSLLPYREDSILLALSWGCRYCRLVDDSLNFHISMYKWLRLGVYIVKTRDCLYRYGDIKLCKLYSLFVFIIYTCPPVNSRWFKYRHDVQNRYHSKYYQLNTKIYIHTFYQKESLKNRWTTIPPISTKRRFTSHPHSLSTKMTTTCDVANPDHE